MRDWVDIALHIIIIAVAFLGPYLYQRLASIYFGRDPPSPAAGFHAFRTIEEALANGYLMGERREAFFNQMSPSFPPEAGLRISNGPLGFRWDRPLDNFWWDVDADRSFLRIDRGHHISYLNDEMRPEIHAWAKLEFRRVLETVESLSWSKDPIGRGRCYDTVCAVHRWNAREKQEDGEQRVVGRMQCWTDESLFLSDPKFVKEHPEFDPEQPFPPEGYGTVCLVEVGDSAIAVGCPSAHSYVVMNTFEFSHSHGENDWHLDIQNDGTMTKNIIVNGVRNEQSTPANPVNVMKEMTDFSLMTMCDFGGCEGVEDPQDAV